MTRGIALASPVRPSPSRVVHVSGFVDVEGFFMLCRLHGKDLRVCLNGEDVTSDCVAFDADEGRVWSYSRSQDGRYVVRGGEIALAERRGTVEVRE